MFVHMYVYLIHIEFVFDCICLFWCRGTICTRNWRYTHNKLIYVLAVYIVYKTEYRRIISGGSDEDNTRLIYIVIGGIVGIAIIVIIVTLLIVLCCVRMHRLKKSRDIDPVHYAKDGEVELLDGNIESPKSEK